MVIEHLNSIIKNSKNILLVSHINPDGDTLGSMCGLYSLIKDNLKKKCDMVAVSDVPVTYSFLPYVDEVKHISQYDLSREYDLVITIDVAAIDRCVEAEKLFKKAIIKPDITIEIVPVILFNVIDGFSICLFKHKLNKPIIATHIKYFVTYISPEFKKNPGSKNIETGKNILSQYKNVAKNDIAIGFKP